MTKYTLGELDRKISNMYEIKLVLKQMEEQKNLKR